MKLPSGREISIGNLADVAGMLARESFYLESCGDAEESVVDNLRCEFFSLSGTETPVYSEDDITVILDVVRPAAGEISCELAAVMDRYTPISGPSRIRNMIEKEIANAKLD